METLPIRVALVGCGKRKASDKGSLPARELYSGSLFRLSIQYAEHVADDVHILSALHGLLSPHDRLSPYDRWMNRLTQEEKEIWAADVINSLDDAYPDTRIHILFFAGMTYIRPLVPHLRDRLGYWTWENPLINKGLFQRLSWLKENLHAVQE